MDYILHLSILICIYTILAQSLSLVAGYSGQISLAHAGFYGIGAYVTALLTVNFAFPVLLTIPIALLISGIIGYIVSKVAVKTVDDYYIIITLGIQVVIFSIMNNWQEVTRGPMGIPRIPSFSLFGFQFDSKISFLLLSAVFTGLVWFILQNLTKSPFGRVLRGLSEDEVYTKSIGKNVGNYKVISFVISGMLASIAGVLYAHYISYIDPTSFTIDESIFILSIVIIGGMRNLKGIFFAAAFLVLLPEALRFIGMPSSVAANMRQIIYGIALILVIYRMAINKSKTMENANA
ncbi:branched-chain amino acid ABC transporter permease [Candidatus Nomurabacteria bacterium]|nr:branched-chain amino acid ABC transporter permease [Bacteroidota bacterium]MCB9820913.1 branched-chain amino acid ABC transporter permease [Candidatus Nomurabacteria bacterium]